MFLAVAIILIFGLAKPTLVVLGDKISVSVCQNKIIIIIINSKNLLHLLKKYLFSRVFYEIHDTLKTSFKKKWNLFLIYY